jgi:excisionase family DNA binding protein
LHNLLQRSQPAQPPLRLALTIREAAIAIGVSENTFAAMLRRGDIGCVRVAGKGSRVVVPIKSLERYLEENCSKPDSAISQPPRPAVDLPAAAESRRNT